MLEIRFTPFPNLTTDRLYLRQVNTKDENDIFLLRSDEEVSKFLDRPIATAIEEVQKFIGKINDGIHRDEWILWAITLKGEDRLMGTICLWNISREHSKAEVGYELISKYQGKGIMQEALAAVITYGFESMGLNEIEAYTHFKNLKSTKLLERNNFIRKETVDNKAFSENEMTDNVIYVLVNNDIE